MIKWLNTYLNAEFNDLGLDKSPISSNAWLAGFSEGDSCFDVRTTSINKLTKSRCAVRFRIEQQQFDSVTGLSNKSIMQAICDYFTVSLNMAHHNTPAIPYWLIETSSQLRTGLWWNTLTNSHYSEANDWIMKILERFIL